MGSAYRYIPVADVIVTVWDGRVTSAELTELALRQVVDSDWSHCRKRITDARTADTSGFTADDAHTICAIYEPGNANMASVKLAILSSRSPEIAQWAERSLDGRGISAIVFNDAETASAWLSVDADTVLTTIRHLRHELRDPA
jgi:hypothetical protein